MYVLQVHGYVRAATKVGVFVQLSRHITARVKLAHLSDGFVEDPKAAFPEGKLVKGRVMAMSGDK